MHRALNLCQGQNIAVIQSDRQFYAKAHSVGAIHGLNILIAPLGAIGIKAVKRQRRAVFVQDPIQDDAGVFCPPRFAQPRRIARVLGDNRNRRDICGFGCQSANRGRNVVVHELAKIGIDRGKVHLGWFGMTKSAIGDFKFL